ncbi:MAG: hypothetical protein B6U78_00040 [Candidatus Aenigmarchaeota archaeon ex4484_224]|nr:MAG: hypothetical protein B6U78_00040 [Candidatus Aenigmarchaeota archaeon ex4484_224]
MKEIFVGCCGFCESQKNYFKDFKTIEIQKTFYQLIDEKLAKKWKEKASKEFIFNLKVFQGISHPAEMPTWRRSNLDFEKLKGKVGFLKPTKEVFEFWKKMIKVAKILEAKVLVIQMPKKFENNQENWENAEKFFEKIERRDFLIGIELRGWNDKERKKFCKKFELIDIVDPFANRAQHLTKKKVFYFRLHGSPPGKKMYSYKYTKKDFEFLIKEIKSLKFKEGFVMFNNIFMKDDAKEFLKFSKKNL